MHDPESLLDVHERAHRGLRTVLTHCGAWGADAFDRSFDGFGYPTVRLQLLHVVGAEAYWIGVLEGRIDAEDRDASLLTLASVEAWRAEVFAATRAHLLATSAEALRTPREMETWGGRRRTLVPARVVLRTITHLFHHQGQLAAMCRLLGQPVAGIDFPLD